MPPLLLLLLSSLRGWADAETGFVAQLVAAGNNSLTTGTSEIITRYKPTRRLCRRRSTRHLGYVKYFLYVNLTQKMTVLLKITASWCVLVFFQHRFYY